MAATIFAGCVVFVCVMLFWFRVVRPVLEDYGVITVNSSEDSAPDVMSWTYDTAPVDPLSSKDGQGDGRTDSMVIERADLLMFYKLLRKYGVPREEARPVLKAIRVPLSNDVWRDAAPAEPPRVTPIAGRPTSAVFETDPDYPYAAPPA